MEDVEESVIHAKLFANKFHELITNFQTPMKDLNMKTNRRVADYNENIIDFLTRIKKCTNSGSCDAQTFLKQMIKMNTFKLYEMELWWYLLKCGVMNQEDFFYIFCHHSCLNILQYFCEELYKIIVHNKSESSIRKNMTYDFVLILLEHKEKCDLQLVQSSAYNTFLNCFVSKDIVQSKEEIMNLDSIADILKMLSVKDYIIKSFLLDLIGVLLKGKSVTIETALIETECYLKTGKQFLQKNLKIFDVLDSGEIIEYFKQIFVKGHLIVHYQNLFYFVSLLATYKDDNFKLIKGFIMFLLENALNTCNKMLLLNVFILLRLCSSQLVPHFPSYLNWFSSLFSNESCRPINDKEKATFFMDFLNETVVFDYSHYLRVHINRVPCLPMDCQSLLSDYVKLVKTKLIDLNETADLGLFENTSDKTTPEYDVEAALNIYLNTNEVPKCVLEASLFYKVYYEKKFLVTLLSKFEGKNSVRHKFITKLHSLGKIPNSLYLSYKQLF